VDHDDVQQRHTDETLPIVEGCAIVLILIIITSTVITTVLSEAMPLFVGIAKNGGCGTSQSTFCVVLHQGNRKDVSLVYRLLIDYER
jgi:hypothetical protein